MINKNDFYLWQGVWLGGIQPIQDGIQPIQGGIQPI